MIRDIYHTDDSPTAIAAFNARSERRPHPTVPAMTKDATEPRLFTNHHRKDETP